MGMTQNDKELIMQAAAKQDAMTPERLALILGLKVDTLYRAWIANGLNGWAKKKPLDQDSIDTIILYYANLGNETAIGLSENARMRKETPAENGGKPEPDSPASAESANKEAESAPVKPSGWYYIADAIFLGVLAVSGYELWFFLGRWGLFFWAIYAAAVSLSLFMAKDQRIPRTAEAGFTAVCIFEALAFFGHFAMANLLIVNAAKANLMPFQYDAWGTLSAPFYIALVVACVPSGIVIYAVWIRLSITKELNKK